MGDTRAVRSVRMVPLPRLVRHLGGPVKCGLKVGDFAGPAATVKQLAALAKWRVGAPMATPRAVAGKLIAVLVKRVKLRLAEPWQLNKLAAEYGYNSADINTISCDDAMTLIDWEQERRGEGRFRRPAGGR